MMISGAMTAMITPFRNGKLDEDRLKRNVQYQITNGIDALVPVGTTGESPTLDFEEHKRVIELTIAAGAGRVPVIAGTGANATSEALELHEFAKQAGANACLSVNPYYNKPSQEGLYRHFMTLADKVDLPIVLYNIPGRTAVNMTPATIARLSRHRNIVAVKESTAGLTTVTGFFEHNSVVLHIGDELVTFGGVSQQAPWRFTGVKRGALGTRAAAHEQGAKARHLKECFGLFVPDVESSLFEEVAANHADVVNRCGFDGIYLDAIDGSSILRGADQVWYWADKFVVEIQKRLKQPVGMEMSAMGHHFWQYRTRWQAWDYPQRGHLRFVDLHAEGVDGVFQIATASDTLGAAGNKIKRLGREPHSCWTLW